MNRSTTTGNARISLNKLAEYLEADSQRRKKIVYDAKYPQEFITTRYREVRPCISDYLCGRTDDDGLRDLALALRSRKSGTKFQLDDYRNSADSIDHFLNQEKSALSGLDFVAPEDNFKMVIAGVSISINPDLIIYNTIRGVRNVGAIKMHLSKSNTLTLDSQKAVAAILHQYVKDHIAEAGERPNPNLCFSSDIFSEKIVLSPSSHVRIMQKVEIACEEIALRWVSI